MNKIRTLLLIPALLLPVACDGGSDDADSNSETGSDSGTSGGDVSYAADVEPIFVSMCVADGCHDANSEDFDLSQGVGYDSLVNVPSSLVTIDLVEPGDSDSSYLWLKVDNRFTEVGGTGNQMPVGGQLSGADKATVKAWIDGGAMP